MKNGSTGEEFSFGTTSGNGYVIEVENGFISSELADAVWQRIKDYKYAAWNCEKADITTTEFIFEGPLQFVYSKDDSSESSLDGTLFPRNVNYSVDSTGIYFSGGCPAIDSWNYKSKLEREKISIGKIVGNTSIGEDGRINYIIK